MFICILVALICVITLQWNWVGCKHFDNKQVFVTIANMASISCELLVFRLDCVIARSPYYLVYFLLGISPASNCSRPTTIWRRGNTQKKIYNIQITAKVWNQESILPPLRPSVSSSLCPHVPLRLSLDGFSWNFTLKHDNLLRKSKFG